AYGTAEEVVAHADEQRGKLKENLLAHGEDVLRNKQLMRLRDDVPLPVGVRDLRMGAWDRAEIHRLFDTLELHTLRERRCARPRASRARSTRGSRSRPGGCPRASWRRGWRRRPPAGRSPWPRA